MSQNSDWSIEVCDIFPNESCPIQTTGESTDENTNTETIITLTENVIFMGDDLNQTSSMKPESHLSKSIGKDPMILFRLSFNFKEECTKGEKY